MRTAGEWIFHAINYALFTLFMLVCTYPFYYIFIYSISDPMEAARGLALLPKGMTFESYGRLLRNPDIGQSFYISAMRAVAGTALTVFCSSLFAYIVTKPDLYARKWLYRFVIVTLYLNAGLIPWYITMKELGLKNNFLLYVLPSAIVGFFVILLKTYMEQLPDALEESATMDGAGFLRIFFFIIFPLSMPIIATVAVFSAVNQWNAWTDNFFLVSDDRLQTLQLTLLNVLRESESLASQSMVELTRQGRQFVMTPTSIRMTITMIVTLPILFVYPFLQRFFVKGIMLGAVKG